MSRLILKKPKILLLLFLGLFTFLAGVLWQQKPAIKAWDENSSLNNLWDWCFYCLGSHDYCGRSASDLTAICGGNEEGKNQKFGPNGSCPLGGTAESAFNNYKVSCTSLQKDQFYSEQGASSIYNNPKTNCDDCIDIETAEFTDQGLRIVARGYSELPKTNYPVGCQGLDDPHDEKCAKINMGASALLFKFDLSGAVTQSSGDQGVSSSCVPDAETGTTELWTVLGHDPRAKKIICTAEYTFAGVTPSDGLQVSVVVKNPVVTNDNWPGSPNPECQMTMDITPTPTPTPEAQLVCVDPMTVNPDPPIGGQAVSLTCYGAALNAVIDRFEFQYREAGSGWIDLGSRLDTDGNNQETINLDTAPQGDWETRCRVCLESGQCSQWYEP